MVYLNSVDFFFRSAYHIMSYFLFYFNIFLGIFSCLLRIFFGILFGVVFMQRLQKSTLPRQYEKQDPGEKHFFCLREMLYKRVQLLPHSYILYIDKEQNYMDQLLILIQASLKSFCKMIKNLSIKYQVYIVSCNILSKSTVCEPLNISSNSYHGDMF